MANISVSVSGCEMAADLWRPKNVPAPGIVLLQEIFGVNDFVRWIGGRLADEGFVVIAPDLFHRMEPGVDLGYDDESREKALSYYSQLDQKLAQDDSEAAVKALSNLPYCNGRVAAVGFCLGGKIVLNAAARSKIDAGVAFYPVEVLTYHENLKDICCPLQIHIGSEDSHSTSEARSLLQAAMREIEFGEYHLHEGGQHGFFNPVRDTAYHPEATAEAYSDLVRFLRDNL